MSILVAPTFTSQGVFRPPPPQPYTLPDDAQLLPQGAPEIPRALLQTAVPAWVARLGPAPIVIPVQLPDIAPVLPPGPPALVRALYDPLAPAWVARMGPAPVVIPRQLPDLGAIFLPTPLPTLPVALLSTLAPPFIVRLGPAPVVIPKQLPDIAPVLPPGPPALGRALYDPLAPAFTARLGPAQVVIPKQHHDLGPLLPAGPPEIDRALLQTATPAPVARAGPAPIVIPAQLPSVAAVMPAGSPEIPRPLFDTLAPPLFVRLGPPPVIVPAQLPSVAAVMPPGPPFFPSALYQTQVPALVARAGAIAPVIPQQLPGLTGALIPLPPPPVAALAPPPTRPTFPPIYRLPYRLPDTAPTLALGVAPGAPQTVSAIPANAGAVVSWTAPANRGTGGIAHYTVTASPGGATAQTTDARTVLIVTGLTNGTAYTFTITATAVAGLTGPASAPSSSVTPLATYPPPQLILAQQQATTTPVISAVLRAKRGSATRLDPTTLYTNTLTDVACAVASPLNGNIVRAHLTGGNVQVQSVVSGFTSWTTLAAAFAPAAGLGVALATIGHSVFIAYLTDSTHWALQVSLDDGVTWGGVAASASNTGVVTDLAIAFAPNAGWLLVTGDSGGTIRSWRNGTASASLVPSGSAFVNSIALAYSGDWLALFGWQDANLDYVASAIFGNGGQQTANTWSAVTDVLGIAPGNAASPSVTGFAWGSDGGHAIITELWAIAGGYNGNFNYALECSSTAAFAGGYWTEPAPFPYTSPSGATIIGADLAYSQATAGLYVAAGENLVATLAPPADVDLSARVVLIDSLSLYHSGHTLLVLDNSDGALTSLATSRGTLGLRLDLALGYQTTAGAQAMAQPQRWVIKAEASWVAGRHLLTLTCHDGWQLLHQLVARRQATFGTTLGLPTRTVDQLIHWILARAGIEYTVPAASTLRSRTPNWSVLPDRSFGALMLDLLDSIEGWLLMTSSGATVIPLAAADPFSYAFGLAGGHPVLQVFHTQELQTTNLVTIFTGTAGVLPEKIAAPGLRHRRRATLGPHRARAHRPAARDRERPGARGRAAAESAGQHARALVDQPAAGWAAARRHRHRHRPAHRRELYRPSPVDRPPLRPRQGHLAPHDRVGGRVTPEQMPPMVRLSNQEREYEQVLNMGAARSCLRRSGGLA